MREIQPCGGEHRVILRNGRELPLGRTYRDHVDWQIDQCGRA
jgi:hypothetical protein